MIKLLALVLLPFLARSALARLHIVGEKHRWKDGVNYTDWSLRNHFFEQDWLGICKSICLSFGKFNIIPRLFFFSSVFYFQKGMHDVVQVRNESAYNQCVADDPILNWSRGHSFAMQLNHSGRYYFICSRGHCFGGMKFTLLVEPLPPSSPASPPSSTTGSAVSSSIRFVIAVSAVVLGSFFGV